MGDDIYKRPHSPAIYSAAWLISLPQRLTGLLFTGHFPELQFFMAHMSRLMSPLVVKCYVLFYLTKLKPFPRLRNYRKTTWRIRIDGFNAFWMAVSVLLQILDFSRIPVQNHANRVHANRSPKLDKAGLTLQITIII